MAHKKGLGSSKNGRDSNPKYLGVKMFDGQAAKPGNIIVRQRGTKFRPGPGTEIGRDDSIFAVATGHGLRSGRAVSAASCRSSTTSTLRRPPRCSESERPDSRPGRQGRRRGLEVPAREVRPKGGPDGGDGGDGGDVVLVADPSLRDLSSLRRRRLDQGREGRERPRRAQARRRRRRRRAARSGRHAGPHDGGDLIADLAHPGARVVLAKGGQRRARQHTLRLVDTAGAAVRRGGAARARSSTSSCS